MINATRGVYQTVFSDHTERKIKKTRSTTSPRNVSAIGRALWEEAGNVESA